MFHKQCKFACCSYGVQVYLSWVVLTISKQSQTRGTGSKLSDKNLRWLRLLFMCLFIFLPLGRHLCNLLVMKRNIVLSIEPKTRRESATAAYHWIQENKTDTMVKSLSQTDNYSSSHGNIYISWDFCRKYIHIADALIICRTNDHLASVPLFLCSECVSQTVRYIECHLYACIMYLY